MHRCHAPDLVPGDRDVALSAAETHHLVNVVRARVGNEVRVFDGRGHEFDATVATIARRSARLTIGAPVAPRPEPRVAITLAQAVLKTDRMNDVVGRATMLGATAIQPLLTDRTVVPAAAMRGAAGARWSRLAVAAARQSGRAVVPLVHEPVRFGAFIEAGRDGPTVLLAEPSAGGAGPVFTPEATAIPDQAVLMVGPEGGWSPDECRAARHAGCLEWRVSRLTLGADAAGPAALAVLLYLWDR